ncbi:MAG: hypothetical protein V1736_03900 [Pseudomonadota bacterium]
MAKGVSKNIISGKNARIVPAPIKPVGKSATILYKKLPDDMILITGFEGFLNIDEILDKYGRTIAIAYNAYPSHMTGFPNMISLVGIQSNLSTIVIGQIHCKGAFSTIVAHVKKCGALLHDIIQACDKGEVKRIKI